MRVKNLAEWLIMPLIVLPTGVIMYQDGYPIWAPITLVVLANPVTLLAVCLGEFICTTYEKIKGVGHDNVH
jgi:hypothetical protein